MATPVSGPGRFSERTDKAVGAANKQLPDADYGEQAAYQEQLQAAPMAQAPDFASMFGNPAANVVGFGEPTQQPDVPVTDGAAAGPGAGIEALGTPRDDPGMDKIKSWVAALEWMANQPNSSDSARNLLRQVKANYGV